MNRKAKQIAAIICILLLVLLYVATLVVSLLDFAGSEQLFAACLTATIGLPILMWIYIWLYGRLTQKQTIAEIFPDNNQNTAPNDMAENDNTNDNETVCSGTDQDL